MQREDQDLDELYQLHVSLLLQVDRLEARQRRQGWWTLTLALLLLCLTVVVWRLT